MAALADDGAGLEGRETDDVAGVFGGVPTVGEGARVAGVTAAVDLATTVALCPSLGESSELRAGAESAGVTVVRAGATAVGAAVGAIAVGAAAGAGAVTCVARTATVGEAKFGTFSRFVAGAPPLVVGEGERRKASPPAMMTEASAISARRRRRVT